MELREVARMRLVAGVCLIVSVLGCGQGVAPESGGAATVHRKLTVWVDTDVDVDMARALGTAGVSTLVVRRGRVDVRAGAPVLHLTPAPATSGDIATSSALRLETGRGTVASELAIVLWNALRSSLGPTESELILDIPESLEGMDDFIRRFRRESGLQVVPVLTLDQLANEDGLAVARASGVCIVPLFGTGGVGMAPIRVILRSR